MMRRFLLSCSVILLAACSGEPARQESADDFANRIGAEGGSVASGDGQAGAPLSNTAAPAPPAGADVTTLEQLQDIANVDLGPRDGGCTFMEGNREMIIASGLNEPTLPGKAAIRVGGGLTILDAPPGGLEAIKGGTTFTGEGVTVRIAPAAGTAQSRPAAVTVTDASGRTASYSGKWICS